MPSRQKTISAADSGRDRRAEPARVRHGQQIKRAGKNHDAREKTPPRAGGKRLAFRQHEQHHGVDEMVKHGFFPDRRRAVLRERFFSPCAPNAPSATARNPIAGRAICVWPCRAFHLFSAKRRARCCNCVRDRCLPALRATRSARCCRASGRPFTSWPSRNGGLPCLCRPSPDKLAVLFHFVKRLDEFILLDEIRHRRRGKCRPARPRWRCAWPAGFFRRAFQRLCRRFF
jgi:hypothetical protein